jgi:hypothetical protein
MFAFFATETWSTNQSDGQNSLKSRPYKEELLPSYQWYKDISKGLLSPAIGFGLFVQPNVTPLLFCGSASHEKLCPTSLRNRHSRGTFAHWIRADRNYLEFEKPNILNEFPFFSLSNMGLNSRNSLNMDSVVRFMPWKCTCDWCFFLNVLDHQRCNLWNLGKIVGINATILMRFSDRTSSPSGEMWPGQLSIERKAPFPQQSAVTCSLFTDEIGTVSIESLNDSPLA